MSVSAISKLKGRTRATLGFAKNRWRSEKHGVGAQMNFFRDKSGTSPSQHSGFDFLQHDLFPSYTDLFLSCHTMQSFPLMISNVTHHRMEIFADFLEAWHIFSPGGEIQVAVDAIHR